MGTDEPLVARIRKAAQRSGERVWQMPLYPEYLEATRSDVADLKNTAGRRGSLVTAAAFLQGFAKDAPWAHLDIAGTAWTDSGRPDAPRGATGVGVRLLADLLANWS
jgi:leucyl aminopeptidase